MVEKMADVKFWEMEMPPHWNKVAQNITGLCTKEKDLGFRINVIRRFKNNAELQLQREIKSFD